MKERRRRDVDGQEKRGENSFAARDRGEVFSGRKKHRQREEEKLGMEEVSVAAGTTRRWPERGEAPGAVSS